MNSRIISPDNDFSAKAPFSIQEGRCREALARFFLSLPPAGQQSDAQRAAYRAALRLLHRLEIRSVLQNAALPRPLSCAAKIPRPRSRAATLPLPLLHKQRAPAFPRQRAAAACQQISAPEGISLSGVISESFPSLSSAHRSIPSDTIPASFAGFKFVTTITFLPTISSGE